ncbi:MAG: hypothetical protein ACPGRW_06345 [Flavobacteriaceae bacterium]
MITIIVLVGFTSFNYALLDKWGFFHFLQQKAATGQSEFFYRAVNCQLCLTFHLSALVYGVLLLTGQLTECSFIALIAANGIIKLIRN